MFERRLKLLLLFLLIGILILLGRAFQLQVLARGYWQQQAQHVGQKRHLVETTRGPILDVRGREIAVDEPCIDACVEYGALAQDPEWISAYALKRAVASAGRAWRSMEEKQRRQLREDAEEQVRADIDAMWHALAAESGRPLEEIEELRLSTEGRVAMRLRYIQYRRFQKAAGGADEKAPDPWYKRLLAAGASGEIDIDTFERDNGEEQTAYPILRNISHDTYTRLGKDLDRFPGLVLQQGAVRRYPYARAGAHVLGAIGVVQAQDLDSDANKLADSLHRYLPRDLIGRGGLEQLGEPTLRGVRGYVVYPSGQRDQVIEERKSTAGSPLQTTLDIELQAQVQGFFEHAKVISNLNNDSRVFAVPMHGAAVVIDIPTNEVRAIASYPDFDPNTLSDQIAELSRDVYNAPLFNRATHARHPPGSTVKPVVGIGGIMEGVVTAAEGIECTGYLVLGGKVQPNGRCWVTAFLHDPRLGGDVAHHPIPIRHHGDHGNRDGWLCFADAIERSCNVYFETVAHRLGQERLSHWMMRFGLGHETGLGISESTGRVPRPEDQRIPSAIWFSGIGQSAVLATPVQMANVAATVARNGVWMRPRLVRDAKLAPIPPRGGWTRPDTDDLHLAPDAIAAARDGMKRVVNNPSGSGYNHARMEEVTLAGKTGTAQASPVVRLDERGRTVRDSSGKPIELPPSTADHPVKGFEWYRGWGEQGTTLDHAWFIGYAPADNPQVAVAVLVEYGGSGGLAAGSIAKQIMLACAEHGYLKLER